jgi:flagella basal body P-ring formation protein FlgA
MKRVLSAFNIVLIILAGFANSAFSQDANLRIKNETERFFCHALDVKSDEVYIHFTRIPKRFAKYSNHKIEVFSQKNNITPGNQSVWVRIFDGSRLVDKYPLVVEVEVSKLVVVAAKKLRRGTLLKRDNVKLIRKRLGRNWKDYIFEIDQAEGLDMVQTVKAGTPIKTRMAREKPVIHRGQRVEVEIRSDFLKVSTPGFAKRDGYTGEQINVKLEETGVIVSGKVKSSRLVVVYQE